MDTVNWSQDRYTKIRDEIKPFLRDDCGFDTDTMVKFVPISGFKDQNIAEKIDAKICPWYNGKKLLDIFDEVPIPTRDKTGPMRFPILDTSNDDGKFFIHGKLENGSIQFDQEQLL